MLALRTGWTDRTIAEGITDEFRRACHHALYAEAVADDYHAAKRVAEKADELDITTVPTAQRAALRSARNAVAVELAETRRLLGLDDA